MYKGKRILAVIPARGGSKRIPQKNIVPLSGKPMIAWTIEAAKNSQYVDTVLVSTDCEVIKNVALKYGADVPFLRPAEYSTDTASSVAAMQHAVSWVEQQEGVKYDYVIELMCQYP